MMERMLILFLSVLCYGFACGTFTVNPLSVNTTLNSTVTFTCNATADSLLYYIGDKQADSINVTGVIQHSTIELDDGVKSRELQVIAYESNNNSRIMCSSIILNPFNITNSTVANLLIQGLLASVNDLTVYPFDEASVLLSWAPPYTLDNVLITGYYINIIDTPVHNTSVILSSIPSSPCTSVTVSVCAMNEVGKGHPTNMTFFYYDEKDLKAIVANSKFHIKEKGKKVKLKFEIKELLCQNEEPLEANVAITCGLDMDLIYENSFFVESGEQIINDTTPSVSRHQWCFLFVTINYNISTSGPLQLHALNIFDVKEADVVVEAENSICVTCQLSSNYFEGCYVNVVGTSLHGINKNMTIPFENTTQRLTPSDPRYPFNNQRPTLEPPTDYEDQRYITKKNCIPNLPKGTYTVTVYDLENGYPYLKELALMPKTVNITAQLPNSTSNPSSTPTDVLPSTYLTPSPTPTSVSPSPQNSEWYKKWWGIMITAVLMIILCVSGCVCGCVCVKLWKRKGSSDITTDKKSTET